MYAWIAYEIRSLPTIEYRILYCAALAACIALAWYSFTAFRRFRHIDATATSRIRSAAQGQVELKGLGEWMADGQIHSPFSRSRCLWYHCTIDKRKRSGKKTRWTNIHDELSTQLFRLVDDTGECIVDPEGAHVVPEVTTTWFGESASDCTRPPLRRRSLHFGSGRYRFRERLIRPATEIYALGWLRTHYQNPAAEFIDARVADLLRQWKLQPDRYLHHFDLDANGKIEQDEWQKIRAAARTEVLARMASEKQYHHVLSRPAEKRQPYILSAIAEETLVRRKKIKAYGFGLGAFLLFSVLVMMTAARAPMPL